MNIAILSLWITLSSLGHSWTYPTPNSTNYQLSNYETTSVDTSKILMLQQSQTFDLSALVMPILDGVDSITYTVISGFGPVFPTGTWEMKNFSLLLSNDYPSVNVAIEKGYSSLKFSEMTLYTPQPNGIVIEIKIYKVGSSVPYFSYKLSNVKVLTTSIGSSFGVLPISDNFTLNFTTIGVKDNGYGGGSIAFDIVNQIVVPY